MPTQVPSRQTSPAVSALPSSQGVSSALGRLGEHSPFLHVPGTWHWESGAHTTSFSSHRSTPWQTPAAVHASKSVSGSPSLQLVPSSSSG